MSFLGINEASAEVDPFFFALTAALQKPNHPKKYQSRLPDKH